VVYSAVKGYEGFPRVNSRRRDSTGIQGVRERKKGKGEKGGKRRAAVSYVITISREKKDRRLLKSRPSPRGKREKRERRKKRENGTAHLSLPTSPRFGRLYKRRAEGPRDCFSSENRQKKKKGKREGRAASVIRFSASVKEEKRKADTLLREYDGLGWKKI